MITRIKFVFLIVFFPIVTLFAEEAIRGVIYLKPNARFSSVSDIYINNGIISRIMESKQKDSIRYVLPSFCDSYLTLGANSVGGQNNLDGIKIALKSLLFHGFTHIHSVADGPWIYKIKADVDSGKILGPKIIISERPIVPKNAEVGSISDLLYFVADNEDLTLKEFQRQKSEGFKIIHLFNRNSKENEVFSFEQEMLNQLRLDAKEENRIISIHTFAERLSIVDALVSGNRYLVHPISSDLENEITTLHKRELRLTPILNVYRNLQLDDSENGDGLLELDFLKKQSSFFANHYSSNYQSNLKKDMSKNELKKIKAEYSSYLNFIRNNPILIEKMILGSGSGHRLSFPGVSGIQELKILSELGKFDEALFRVATQNSCSYMNQLYDGVIAVGREANVIVLKENPVKDINTLFHIEAVFKEGTRIQLEPKIKNSKRK